MAKITLGNVKLSFLDRVLLAPNSYSSDGTLHVSVVVFAINRVAEASFQLVKEPLTHVWLSAVKLQAPEAIAAVFKICSYGLAERSIRLTFSGDFPINKMLSGPFLEAVSAINRKDRFKELNCIERSNT